MKVLSAGGGSGGHVTPVLAVLNELNDKLDGNLEAQFVCDRSFVAQSRALMSQASFEVKVRVIAAGKVRRYHGIRVWRQLLDVPTLLLNIRDIFLIGLGTLQSVWLLLRWRPDVVFTKGGFVCVPVGLAARLLRVPIVMHDSDTHPGLANRILSKWAVHIATGSPLKYYSYPAKRTTYVGVPISAAFHPLDEAERAHEKLRLGFRDSARPLVVVTGGGLGARRINEAFLKIALTLTQEYKANVLHITGKANYDELHKRLSGSEHYKLLPFVEKGMASILGAADVVVTRAGATTMLELAAVRACTVIIPHPHLTGGHQLKNAAMYEETGAARIVPETGLVPKPDFLLATLKELLDDKSERERLGAALGKYARPAAAKDVAELIEKAGRK